MQFKFATDCSIRKYQSIFNRFLLRLKYLPNMLALCWHNKQASQFKDSVLSKALILKLETGFSIKERDTLI